MNTLKEIPIDLQTLSIIIIFGGNFLCLKAFFYFFGKTNQTSDLYKYSPSLSLTSSNRKTYKWCVFIPPSPTSKKREGKCILEFKRDTGDKRLRRSLNLKTDWKAKDNPTTTTTQLSNNRTTNCVCAFVWERVCVCERKRVSERERARKREWVR